MVIYHIAVVILDIDMGSGLMIWEMTVSIWEMTVSMWEMTVSIWEMTVSIWDILSPRAQDEHEEQQQFLYLQQLSAGHAGRG
jgi:hypothetical protein